MATQKVRSVEPNIADLVNGWLKSYQLDYKLEQEDLSLDIDRALREYITKSGKKGGNRPDTKLLLPDRYGHKFPILIEYKGYADKLVKLDADGQVENKKANNEPHLKNISSYAVNGAVHYANAILHYTGYTDVIAIGVTGYKDEQGKLQHSIGVYYVSKANYGAGQKIDDYTDLSFLKPDNFDAFIEKVKTLHLTPQELNMLKEKREREVNISLVKLNNDIFQNEKGLQEKDRVYLVASTIIATLGVPDKVAPLEKDELKSFSEKGSRDGDIIAKRIAAFLNEKDLPENKRESILRTLENTLLTDNINKATDNDGKSQLKRVFDKIVDDLGIYYKIGLTTDFTGKLFDEMYRWLGFSQDKLNDVVLTPPYVATLLAKLARVNKDSYVWDFATGSAGLLVAAMNEMLVDAQNSVKSPDELARKSAEIKANQLLGLEIVPEIYMLAVLNMILMGDGSSNIINLNSLKEFDGSYGFGRANEKFPADAFVLNPPYSAPGNGMIFVKTALAMMEKGYAAIIIQNSAGSGKATKYNREILKNNTLLASIKMPNDLFYGKSNVQTNIYVFRVGEAHQKDDIVKFINFSDDGYIRTARGKATTNLQDVDHAKERYQEVADLVRFGKRKLHYLTERDYYEGQIDPDNGADWNQTAPIDTKPTLEDFKKTVGDYLAWEISSFLKNQPKENDHLSATKLKDVLLSPEEEQALADFNRVQWGEYKFAEIFDHIKQGRRLKKYDQKPGAVPFVMSGTTNTGVVGYVSNPVASFPKNSITVDIFGNVFYRGYAFGAGDDTGVYWNDRIQYSDKIMLFFSASMGKMLWNKFSYGHKLRSSRSHDLVMRLPIKGGEIDFNYMENLIFAIQKLVIKNVVAYSADKLAASKNEESD